MSSSHVHTKVIPLEAMEFWKSICDIYRIELDLPGSVVVTLASNFLKMLPKVPFYEPDLTSVTLAKVQKAVKLQPDVALKGATFETMWDALQVFRLNRVAEKSRDKPGLPGDEDAAAVSSAFDLTQYLNVNAVKLLLAHLWLYACCWFSSLTEFYAPYSALINASMTGKSRLVMELRKHGVFLMLICLRPDDDPNYRPPRTPHLADWATRKEIECAQTYTSETCAFFYGYLWELHSFLVSQKEKFPGGHSSSMQQLTEAWFAEVNGAPDSPIWSRIFSEHICTSTSPETKKSSLDKIIGDWRGSIIKLQAKLDLVLAELLGVDVWKAEKARQVNILFVVDEARQLNVTSGAKDRFALFRRAMRCLPYNDKQTRANVFCLVTDTTSKVANLAPVQKYDPSFRIAKHNGQRLFPPFTLIDTVDVWWEAAKAVEVPVTDKVEKVLELLRIRLGFPPVELRKEDKSPVVAATTTESARLGEGGMTKPLLESFELMATMGRPAYYGFLCFRAAVGTSVGFESLVTMLQGKLLCQNPTSSEPVEQLDEELQADFNSGMAVQYTAPLPSGYSTTQVMGVLGAIASVHISAASHLASDLASGHMRLVSAISKQRKYVYTLEVSEPALAFAAHGLIMSGRLPWHVILDKYTAAVLNDTTSIGFRGEIGMQILCLIAWQKCITESPQKLLPEFRFPFVPALDFIKKLLGMEFFEALPADVRTGLEQDLANAYVRMNQFVKTFAELRVDTLREYFIRASGVYCKEGQKAVDLAVSLWFGPDFKDSSFSALLMQVKLHSSALNQAELESWFQAVDSLPLLEEIPAHLPTVAICIELGPGRGAEATVNNFNSRAPRKTATRVEGFMRPEISVQKDGKGPTRRPAKFAYALRFRTVSLANVDPGDLQAINAFNRLVESTIDPSNSLNVEFIHRQNIKHVFRTQPYMATSPRTREDLVFCVESEFPEGG
jgi:hypothetical protein